MKFTKMQACGNDYIYVECFTNKVNAPSRASIVLSNRHFGIGGDGLVLIRPSNVADFKMSMYNSDGTQGKMCGNAVRCVARYVYEHRMTKSTDINIETLSGIKLVHLDIFDGEIKDICVCMGKANFTPNQIPVLSEKNIVFKEEILVYNRRYLISCVSIGNPHGVIFLEKEEELSDINLSRDGFAIEFNRLFPERINVEFVKVLDKNNISVRVWERGTGETLSCGTGACAAVAVGILDGRLSSEVNVHLSGGILKVREDTNTKNLYLSGDTKEVFCGELFEHF